MRFAQLFGQVRSLCHAQPSPLNFNKLIEVSGQMYELDPQRFAERVIAYLLAELRHWPEDVTHTWPSSRSSAENCGSLLFFKLIENMFDDGFAVKSDFIRDYFIRANAIMAPSSLSGVNEIPLGLSLGASYNFELGANFHKHLDRFTQVQRLLIRYLMTYEQDVESYESLYFDYVSSGQWKSISRLGDVGPQHGLFECELRYVERCVGFSFPKVVADFYRLFGRLSGHAVGYADNIINPYTYPHPSYISKGNAIFLWENQGGWAWAYDIAESENPKMILFDDFPTSQFGKKRIDVGEIFTDMSWNYKSSYDIHFSEFVALDRDPSEI